MAVRLLTDEELIKSCLNNGNFMIVDGSYSNISKPITVVGNVYQSDIIGVENERIIIKGISIIAEGNTGTTTVETEDGTVILPLYQTFLTKSSPSAAMNYKIPSGEDVKIRTVGRGETDETFIGISYIIVSC